MKKLLFQYSLCLFTLLIMACGSNPSTETPVKETVETTTPTPEEPQTEQTPEVMVSTDSYQTTVLESGIASPRKEMKGKVGNAEITVNYGSPSVKGRTIWGDLVPNDKIWRTGANATTTIEVSKDVKIEGKTLPAGKYGVFTIPNDKSWTIIFNEDVRASAGRYDEAKDVLRVKVTPKKTTESSEAMEFMIDGDALVLRWANLAVPVRIAAT